MCDTFGLSKGYFQPGYNCFVKVSDRITGEAQPLKLFKGGKHTPGEMIKLTHVEVEQVESTYTFMGCHSFWCWGVGMGINECGFAVGNNAEGSRTPLEPGTNVGIIGVDLCRLALERAATAREGIKVITHFIEKFGQNATTSEIRKIIAESTYLLVDPNEVWILETAGRRWVAKQVKDWGGFSNQYTIGEDFDMCSPDVEEYARKKRWLAPGEKFNFARAYQLATECALARWKRVRKLVNSYDRPLAVTDILRVLRDHMDGELLEQLPGFGDFYGTFQHVCNHAQAANDGQTTASFISWTDDDLGPVCRYMASVSCCSIAIPAYLKGRIPAAMACGEWVYDPNSLFWTIERLVWTISIDGERFGDAARAKLRVLENEIFAKTEEAEAKARLLIKEGKEEEAFEILSQLTEEAVKETMELADKLYEEIRAVVDADGGLYGHRKEAIEEYCARVKMPLTFDMMGEKSDDYDALSQRMAVRHHS